MATYGNLVHRVLTMVSRNFDGKVPEPGPLDQTSDGLLSEARRRFAETTDNLEVCRFRTALQSAISLAREGNRYLEQRAPWRQVKTDRNDAATTLWVGHCGAARCSCGSSGAGALRGRRRGCAYGRWRGHAWGW